MTNITDKVVERFGETSLMQAVVDADDRQSFIDLMNGVLLKSPNATPRRVAQVSRTLWRRFHGLRFFYDAGEPIGSKTYTI